jgi:hypothetical protein
VKVSPVCTLKNLTPDRLLRHFRATGRTDVIGLHVASPDNTCRFGFAEWDNHEGSDEKHRKNSREAKALHRSLVRDGFRPLLVKYGNGSYHLWVPFRCPVPADVLRDFLVGLDAGDEVFPKSGDVRKTKKGVGNWVRLFGKHHSRDRWAEVWDGERWLRGHRAIDHILTLKGDDPKLIGWKPTPAPEGLITDDPVKEPADKQASNGSLTQRLFNSPGSLTGDVKEPYVAPAAARLFNAPAWLTRPGRAEWKCIKELAARHCPDRVGRRNARMGRFIQAVRGVALLDERGQERAFDFWWRGASKVVGTSDRAFNLDEFKRRFPTYHTPFIDWKKAARLARKDPLPDHLREAYDKRTRRLLRAMARVQFLVGAGDFSLSYPQAAPVLAMGEPCSFMTALRVLRRLDQDGVVFRTMIGQKWKARRVSEKGKKRKPYPATRWLYLPAWTEDELQEWLSSRD